MKHKRIQERRIRAGCVRLGDLVIGVRVRYHAPRKDAQAVIGRIIWVTQGSSRVQAGNVVYEWSPELDVEVMKDMSQERHPNGYEPEHRSKRLNKTQRGKKGNEGSRFDKQHARNARLLKLKLHKT